jgi:hypothetical protein
MYSAATLFIRALWLSEVGMSPRRAKHIRAWTMVMCGCVLGLGDEDRIHYFSLVFRRHTHSHSRTRGRWGGVASGNERYPPAAAADVAEKNDVIENPFFTHFNADSCEMILLLQTDLAHWEVARGIFTLCCDLGPTIYTFCIYYAFTLPILSQLQWGKGSPMGLAGHVFAGDIANVACFTLVFPQGHFIS